MVSGGELIMVGLGSLGWGHGVGVMRAVLGSWVGAPGVIRVGVHWGCGHQNWVGISGFGALGLGFGPLELT